MTVAWGHPWTTRAHHALTSVAVMLPAGEGRTSMTVSDVDAPQAPQRQVVCIFTVAAAAEEVLRAWIHGLENDDDESVRACIGCANCGVVQQRQFMRIVVGRALDGITLTQQDADHINGAMGNPFIPTTLPALANVLQSVLREDAGTGPTSVAAVEAAYSLTS
jgi:hypothetical protein